MLGIYKMNNTNKFTWVPFYEEFAEILLKYKDNRKELVEKVKEIFKDSNIEIPTLERGGGENLVDIDPFTIFAIFNKQLKQENRMLICTTIAKIFKVVSSVPSDFLGIPVCNNMNATFYYFVGDRKDDDIDKLWMLYESALAYKKNMSIENKEVLSRYFDIVIKMKGIGTSKITMGLFWIAPNCFLNLDRRNRWYIYEAKKIPNGFISLLPLLSNYGEMLPGKIYFEILGKIQSYLQSDESKFKNFQELSLEAHRYSQEVNEQIKENKKSQNQEFIETNDDSIHYWVYSPGENAKIWNECYQNGYMAIEWKELGDLRNFENKEDLNLKVKELYNKDGSAKNDTLTLWSFYNEIKNGDIVYAKQGTRKILGRGVVKSDYEFDNSQDSFVHVRKVEWRCLDKPIEIPNELGKFAQKTLTDITKYKGTRTYLEKAFLSQNQLADTETTSENSNEPYSEEKFLDDVYISKNDYNTLKYLLKTKKNIILQGAPGTGKTFAAKKLAYSIIRSKNDERVKLIQFHQSYSYEDFIMGYRPTENCFKLETGVFYDFCEKAKNDPNNDYFFIIDEINRGNLSRIFGELFMLIESDKRGEAYKVNLVYDKNKEFFVPQNVYIIGLMNTADRSLAFLDYALRRRFAFFDMTPGFDNDNFKEYLEDFKNENFNKLIDNIKKLNEEIKNDESLGIGFQIGHSFFCNLDKDKINESLKRIVTYEILPLLKEYWFDETDKIKKWSDNLKNCIKDN